MARTLQIVTKTVEVPRVHVDPQADAPSNQNLLAASSAARGLCFVDKTFVAVDLFVSLFDGLQNTDTIAQLHQFFLSGTHLLWIE